MRMYDIISKKRDSLELTDEEIGFFVREFTAGRIPDCQASALLMAIYLNGMTKSETVSLTMHMAHSGDMLELSGLDGVTVDKHSTGGVGDKTTLIVAPIAAALGAKVAKMSGRGLGHTGGTIDKLEAIPGFNTSLEPGAFISQVKKIGISVVGQTGCLAPADKKIYALRDETATVGCIPLIASSIMSKKLAAGSHCIVLDVKTGSGAFMKTPEKAAELARTMVDIGTSSGRRVAAVVTDMDTPLGCNIGNALEVIEAIDVLSGKLKNDLYDVSIELSAHMISLAFGLPHSEACEKCRSAVESGAALGKLRELVAAQGGDVSVINDTSLFRAAPIVWNVLAPESGYISAMDAENIGTASLILGAGREGSADEIDHSAGIVLLKKTGSYVNEGDVIAKLHTSRENSIKEAESRFLSALSFSENKPQKMPLVYQTVV